MNKEKNNGINKDESIDSEKENPEELLAEHHQEDVISKTGNTPSKNQVNLAGKPKFTGKLKEMEKLLLSEMKRLNDPYRFWDQPE